MPPKVEQSDKEAAPSLATSDNALKPLYVPKIPVRRKKVETAEQNMDILAGPQQRQPRTAPERPKRDRPGQAPVKVSFQAPTRGLNTRSAPGRTTYSSNTVDSYNENQDGEYVFASEEKPDISDIPPQPLPFVTTANDLPWQDYWTGPEPEGLPAYKDPSLPSVIEAMKNISLDKPSSPQMEDTSPEVYPPLSGHGNMFPFQSAADWFYPPVNMKIEKIASETPTIKKEHIKTEHEEVEAEENQQSNEMTQLKEQLLLFQLPSHLPVITAPSVAPSTIPSSASSANNSMTLPQNSSSSSGFMSVSTLNTSNTFYDQALAHDEPIIIDDISKAGITTTQLAKQYKVFSSNDENCIKNVPSGQIGELVVYKSGKVKMRIGKVLYDVSAGVHTPFRQEVVAITPKDNDNHKSDEPTMQLHNLGAVRNHVIVSLDVQSLANQKEKEGKYVPSIDSTN